MSVVRGNGSRKLNYRLLFSISETETRVHRHVYLPKQHGGVYVMNDVFIRPLQLLEGCPKSLSTVEEYLCPRPADLRDSTGNNAPSMNTNCRGSVTSSGSIVKLSVLIRSPATVAHEPSQLGGSARPSNPPILPLGSSPTRVTTRNPGEFADSQTPKKYS
jgi:hypothetical protein